MAHADRGLSPCRAERQCRCRRRGPLVLVHYDSERWGYGARCFIAVRDSRGRNHLGRNYLGPMAPQIGAALIAVVSSLVAGAVGLWRANAALRTRSADNLLLERRWQDYPALWSLTVQLRNAGDAATLRSLDAQFESWYEEHGLALSGKTMDQWSKVKRLLSDPEAQIKDGETTKSFRDEISILRSWLKAELNVRTVGEVEAKVRSARRQLPERSAR